VLRLFDTALGAVTELDLRQAGKVSMYVCGPTVDNLPHIGHGRFNLVWDVLRRYLEWSGYEVRYVSNVTDIEDKIINRARAEARPTTEVVAQYEQAWWEAMDGLGVRRPDAVPHATGYVERMVDHIAALEAAKAAYETADGVYFSVDAVPDYGLLARQSLDTLRAGGGDRTLVGEEHKRSPLDFALWKRAKPDEPSWPSPWGEGRPGWHIECTVMALDLLGEGFDLHGGGIDLAFPHHENERAQSEGVGKRFARHWVHNGMVEMGGQKMSKSIGNITSLSGMLEETDGRAYRLLVLRAHYRSPMEVTPTTLADAAAAVEGLDAFARRAAALGPAEPDAAALEEFRTAMDDDLNTPRATAVLFGLVRRANADGDAAAAAAARSICTAVGLELRAGTGEVDADTADLVSRRDSARQARDFAGADAIRAELQSRGWIVEDGPTGTTVRR
jgi:cysteinyl-tRNA synthetase